MRDFPFDLEVYVYLRPNLRDEALEGLPPSLTKVDMSFCGGLSNAALERLAALPALASCSLRKCGGVTDAVGGGGGVAGALRLRGLTISCCRRKFLCYFGV